MAEQQTLADLTEALRAQLYGGVEGETDDTVGPGTMYQRAADSTDRNFAASGSAPAPSDEDGPREPLQAIRRRRRAGEQPIAGTHSGVWSTALDADRRRLLESLTD
jgi:hypothetical protein